MVAAPMPSVLLCEPQFVLRRTVAAAARQLGIADVREAVSLPAARQMVQGRPHDLVVVALDAGPPDDVAAFVRACGSARVIGLAQEGGPHPAIPGLATMLFKPLKVKDLLRYLNAGATAPAR